MPKQASDLCCSEAPHPIRSAIHKEHYSSGHFQLSLPGSGLPRMGKFLALRSLPRLEQMASFLPYPPQYACSCACTTSLLLLADLGFSADGMVWYCIDQALPLCS